MTTPHNADHQGLQDTQPDRTPAQAPGTSRGTQLRETAKTMATHQWVILCGGTGSEKSSVGEHILLEFLPSARNNRHMAAFLTLTPHGVKKVAGFIRQASGDATARLAELYTSSDQQLYKERTAQLQSGVDVVVATVDRFLAHLMTGNIDPSKIELLIADNIESLADGGCMRDLEKICRLVHPQNGRGLLIGTGCKETLLTRIQGWFPPERQPKIIGLNG